MQIFHLAELNALGMSTLINAQNPCRFPVPLFASMVMSTTTCIASIVNQPLRKPNWFSDRLWSPCIGLWSLCRIKSSRRFSIVSNRHIGLKDEGLSRGFSPFLRRTSLCLFQSVKNLLTRRQLKASRRISRYIPITSLRISFGIPSIPRALLAFILRHALFSSSRVKSSSFP